MHTKHNVYQELQIINEYNGSNWKTKCTTESIKIKTSHNKNIPLDFENLLDTHTQV